MKKYFITGLVILLPLAVTIAIVIFLINFLTKPFVGLVTSILNQFDFLHKTFLFLTPDQIILYTSKILILITLFFFTVLLGVITRWFFIHSLIRLGDRILHRIPIINTVYKTTQEIIKTLFASDKETFKKVVMAPFPHTGAYVIGLVSRESPPECADKTKEELVTVLIPTTPNPTTGFLLMYKQEDLIYLDMKPEQAIKYIVSCGVIVPSTEINELKRS